MRPVEYLYNLTTHLGLPASAVATLVGFQGRGATKALWEKFSSPAEEVVSPPVDFWLHGASVGEMGLVEKIRNWLVELGVSKSKILISAQTFSGVESINHPRKFVLPNDYPWLIGPLYDRADPGWLLVLETELWPNLFRYGHDRALVLNGVLKESSFKYYRLLTPLLRATLGHCRKVLARTEKDAGRFRKFAPASVEVEVGGSLKLTEFLESPPEVNTGSDFSSGQPPVGVAGSTRPEEEQLILEAMRKHGMRFYLAPRHLARQSRVEELLEQSEFDWCLWSQDRKDYGGDVILVDEVGVLAGLYGRGDLAFVGGSWSDEIGGHNLLEPARFGLPVVTGPHLWNVSDSADLLAENGLLFRAESEEDWEPEFSNALAEARRGSECNLQDLREQARGIKGVYVNCLKKLLGAGE